MEIKLNTTIDAILSGFPLSHYATVVTQKTSQQTHFKGPRLNPCDMRPRVK